MDEDHQSDTEDHLEPEPELFDEGQNIHTGVYCCEIHLSVSSRAQRSVSRISQSTPSTVLAKITVEVYHINQSFPSWVKESIRSRE